MLPGKTETDKKVHGLEEITRNVCSTTAASATDPTKARTSTKKNDGCAMFRKRFEGMELKEDVV